VTNGAIDLYNGAAAAFNAIPRDEDAPGASVQAPSVAPVNNIGNATDKNDFISGQNGGSVFFAGGSAFVGGAEAKGTEAVVEGGEDALKAAGTRVAESPKPEPSPAPGAKPADETAPAAPSNAPPGGGCFIAGTLVSTPQGDVPIETIRAGDVVWSLDIKTGHVVEKKVESTFSHVTEYWVDVTAGGEKITATRGHRFWVESLKKWVPAMDLKPGMKLLGSSGHIVPITQVYVRHLPADATTYNFFVADTHVYFVGQHCWLVHNGDDDTSSNAARREAMRQQNIPTSQQPSSQRGDAAHKQYTYEVPAEGGGSETKVVSHHEADDKHPDPHWEAAKAKTDDEGNLREGGSGQIKYESDKSKVTYTKTKC
jgi:hypothetical protein